jgi:hypothetical protein
MVTWGRSGGGVGAVPMSWCSMAGTDHDGAPFLSFSHFAACGQLVSLSCFRPISMVVLFSTHGVVDDLSLLQFFVALHAFPL